MSSETYILGIETSCDETAVALVDRRGYVRVNAVASQIDLHAQFGGVVPEVASRKHIEACLPMVGAALEEADIGWDRIEGIAVTAGPGLIGCLLMGVETAKALAWRYGKPLFAINHLEGHLHAPLLHPGSDGRFHLMLQSGREHRALPFDDERSNSSTDSESSEAPLIFDRPEYPHIGLVVSGGHTSLVRVEAPGKVLQLAATRDDAVGEAYDKIARVMGLGYPGGPIVDRLAAEGDAKAFAFTAPLKRRDVPDFSFSGLKSAVAREVERQRAAGEAASGKTNNGGPGKGKLTNGGPGNSGSDNHRQALDESTVRNLCAAFQATVIEALMEKTLRATAKAGVGDLLVVGGVACNRGLRGAMREATRRRKGLRIWFPHPSLCTDNAAMIAGLAWHTEALGRDAALELNPRASMMFDKADDPFGGS